MRSLKQWTLVSLFLVSLFAFGENPEVCGVPEGFKKNPALSAYIGGLCRKFAAHMDHVKGGGPGDVAREARAFAIELQKGAETITAEDATAVGLDFPTIEAAAMDLGGGKPIAMEVTEFIEAIDFGNQQLQESGINFVTYVQSPVAQLNEAFWNYMARFPPRVVTVDELRQLSLAYYGGELPADAIKVPVAPKDIEEANKKLAADRGAKFRFVGDPHVAAADVPLPALDKPLPLQERVYRMLQRVRWPAAVVLAMGGATSGKISWHEFMDLQWWKAIPSQAGGVALSAWEGWFTFKSGSFWATIWHKYGIPANIFANLLVAVSITAPKLVAEKAMGLPVSETLPQFVAKTMVIGTAAFVLSFGTPQINMSKLRGKGLISEFRRYLFEVVSFVINGGGRVIALTGAGAAVYHKELAGLNFSGSEMVGFGVQLAYFTAVAVPLLGTYYYGHKIRNSVTKDMLNGNEVGLCRRLVAWLATNPLTTPRRRKTVFDDLETTP